MGGFFATHTPTVLLFFSLWFMPTCFGGFIFNPIDTLGLGCERQALVFFFF